MARRKRASMREGPLADLFRATEEPADPPEPPERPPTRSERDAEQPTEMVPAAGEEPADPAAIEDPADEDDGSSDRPDWDDPPRRVEAEEGLSAYRSEDPPRRDPKERLRDVFTADPDDREPAYGRGEPST